MSNRIRAIVIWIVALVVIVPLIMLSAYGLSLTVPSSVASALSLLLGVVVGTGATVLGKDWYARWRR